VDIRRADDGLARRDVRRGGDLLELVEGQLLHTVGKA